VIFYVFTGTGYCGTLTIGGNPRRRIPMAKAKVSAKESAISVKTKVGNLLGSKCVVGEKKNYNFQGSDYTFWPYGTIEQIPSERRYRARAIVTNTSGDNLVF
jgi:hypothetical protein